MNQKKSICIDQTFTDLHKNAINKKVKSAKVLCNKLQSQN